MEGNIKILEIGTVPDTIGIGGVTVHIKRLFDWLYEDEEVRLSLFDYKKHFFSLKLVKEVKDSDIVHIHVNNPLLRLFYIFLSIILRRKTVITVHEEVGIYGVLKNNCVKLAIKLCTVPIVLNKISYDRTKELNKETIIIPAFIPEKNSSPLPQEVINRIADLRNKYKTLVATNAFRRVFTPSGEETYGIEILIDFFKNRDYGLAISDPSGTYKETLQDVPSNVLIIPYPHSFYEVIKLCDVVIRNTATDGDPLTVKEGLALEKHVLATDVVNRPEGVIKYKYKDSDSLEKALLSIEDSKIPQSTSIVNAAYELKKLYKRIIKI